MTPTIVVTGLLIAIATALPTAISSQELAPAATSTMVPIPTVTPPIPPLIPSSSQPKLILEPSESLSRLLAENGQSSAWVLLFIGVQAVATILLFVETLKLARSTRAMAESTKRYAKTSEKIYKASQTPFVFPVNPVVPQLNLGELRVSFQIRNNSSVPAQEVQWWMFVLVDGKETEGAVSSRGGKIPLGPFESVPIQAQIAGSWWDDVMTSKTKLLEIVMRVGCRDSENEYHERNAQYRLGVDHGASFVPTEYTHVVDHR